MSPGEPPAGTSVLGPAVAGTWYPEDAHDLVSEVDRHLAAGTTAGGAAALIAPHAGFAYSGAVAGRGFAHAVGARVDRVVLIGPSHYAAFAGGAAPRADFYRTPLGDVRIDRLAVDVLEGRPGLRLDDGPFRREHSLEAELPFLQRGLAPGWKLVPVLIGAGTRREAGARVADALRPLLGPRTLVVISSDFTHFGPRFGYVPFDDDVPARIERLDTGAIERILAWDVAGFEDYTAATGATICGRDAIGVLLRLMPAPLRGTIAAYDTSGRITGDWVHSVSYASIVFRSPAA